MKAGSDVLLQDMFVVCAVMATLTFMNIVFLIQNYVDIQKDGPGKTMLGVHMVRWILMEA